MSQVYHADTQSDDGGFLVIGSEKAAERGMDYVIRTVNAACLNN